MRKIPAQEYWKYRRERNPESLLLEILKTEIDGCYEILFEEWTRVSPLPQTLRHYAKKENKRFSIVTLTKEQKWIIIRLK